MAASRGSLADLAWPGRGTRSLASEHDDNRRTARPTPTAAIEHFAAKLRYETDPSDVAAALAAGRAFRAGRHPRALGVAPGPRRRRGAHPAAEIAARAAAEIPLDTPVVVYCWGPGCNGATRSALEFLELGYAVREMIGGFEYWAREGLGVVDDHGPVEIAQDRLTSSAATRSSCDC